LRPSRRILYYCQSLVGIGHLSASLRVIEQLLVQGAQVDLIQGGLDTNLVPADPRFRRLVLPTLLHDSARGGFVDPDADEGDEAQADLGAVWAARAQAIDGFLTERYDAVVLEFWPFGRRRFKAEIKAMLDRVRERSGPPHGRPKAGQPPRGAANDESVGAGINVPVFTSVREVLIPRPIEKERRMVASVRKHVHTVFVRGDPEVIRFDETFSLASEIADRLVYTGYIAPPSSASARMTNAPRRNQVLVTQGGGNVGRELLDAAIGVAALMPGLQFVLAAGARTSADEIAALRARVTSANVDIRPFLGDFTEQLRASVLSINMGGDNTLLDVLAARE
jgi:predicted glycosyltransferase